MASVAQTASGAKGFFSQVFEVADVSEKQA